MLLLQQARKNKPRSAEYHDVGAAVRELLIDPDFGNASDRTWSRQIRFPIYWGYPEPAVVLQTVGQHALVAGLEDMER
jgi:hypothetical protein